MKQNYHGLATIASIAMLILTAIFENAIIALLWTIPTIYYLILYLKTHEAKQ